MTQSTHRIVIMAGGTGGHIMPGLAVGHLLRAQGWQVWWLGHPERMEGDMVPEHGFELLPLEFSGLRGKGLGALLKLPFRLFAAGKQARRAFQRVRPQVVLGMGGYVTVPGGLMARWMKIPLVVHEQNAIGGTANRLLARLARRRLVGFPGALPGAVMVGNPVRAAFKALEAPKSRYARRNGPLSVLVLGGSLGARPLNQVIPEALGSIRPAERPSILHQTGAQHLDDVQNHYAQLGVDAECVAFIEDVAQAMAQADIVICRAGAMTVAEVATAGVAALFVPLPHAIDDHQTANARFLADCDAAWLQPQSSLTSQWLSKWLRERQRDELAEVATRAYEHAYKEATERIAHACSEVAQEAA
ncbi:MAG TPA: undecaprenyldiphospho-muramoylpentapeptide beta-N-acetylglucosaminyltransferase [Paenalcaligenes sp.]|nr:undecaprenyldiphospho-muramoylpentapeptide beta-N-acetylglucosaminyltransferase [Paenalcaligenes sp.]